MFLSANKVGWKPNGEMPAGMSENGVGLVFVDVSRGVGSPAPASWGWNVHALGYSR